MFAPDHAHPRLMPTIRFDGPVGPSSPVRRSDETRFTDPVAALAAASLLTVALVVGAFASAQAPAPAPAAKAPAHAVPGEFRLAPGNNPPPGVVMPLEVPGGVAMPGAVAMPGEFRLAPGNNQPPGVVVPLKPVRATGEFRLAPGNNQPPGFDPGR